MARDHDGISAHRLLLASDAVLEAVKQVAARLGGRVPYPPALLGSPQQPAALNGFTPYEVQEATRMLMRLGFLEPG